jgi:hypothetical protein
MKMKFQRQVQLSLSLVVGAVLFLQTGCKQKEAPMQEAQAPSSSAQLQTPSGADTHVHEELYRMAEQPFEHDPAKRPLVLSQPAPSRREWVLQVLKQGYHDTGKTNNQWDAKVQALFEAFADYSRISTTNEPALQKALAGVGTACPDPMVQYMRARYDTRAQTQAKAASEFIRAHETILSSQYHPVFKFYAGLRGVQSSRAADEGANRVYQIERTTASLEDLAKDTNAPVDEIFEPARLWLEHSQSAKWTQLVTTNLEPILKSGWGTTEQWLRFEGNVEVSRAWGDRGWASSRADKAEEAFAEHLSKAEQALEKAWQMNPKNPQTAYLMMRVELGQGQGLSRMELWFNRAMSLQPNYYDAAKLMSLYLEPRWYGSEEKSLAFARACVASDKWKGQVPLVLAELHHALANYTHSNAPAYWQQPQVWTDVKSSYEKLLQSGADPTGWRHSYAMDAYNCGQYPAFLEQVKLFTEGTNYGYFGGPEKFQEMLRTAAAGAKKAQ